MYRSLLRPYIALWGGYGFYRGYTATNRYIHGKENVEEVTSLLVVDKLGNGIVNSFMYMTLPFIPIYKIMGRIEIDRDPTKNKYSYDYFDHYKEFTNMTRLPPRG